MPKELLRRIPKIDQVLAHKDWLNIGGPKEVAKEALRAFLDDLRARIREGGVDRVPAIPEIIDGARKKMADMTAPKLRQVINATGTILHTNLGRSLLAEEAKNAVVNVASHYTNLEYDLEKGGRGERYDHSAAILKRLTGAESAIVVNNNAAAVYLVLNTLAEGREVIVSRGELIEIGGSFRIPDVMKKSGAVLREVGTTNKTYAEDYENAVTENTGLIMKTHTSNYRIRGFTHEVSLEELAALGKKQNVPVYYNTGSGMLYSAGKRGVFNEPVISAETAKGLDLISFSGDKLLGGPQAGIIAGEASLVKAIKKNPLTRAFRPDKLTLAALEATLILYLDMEHARERIPTLRMIYDPCENVRKRAIRLAAHLKKRLSGVAISVIDTFAEVGGGSLPDTVIPSCGLSIVAGALSTQELERRLRALDVPIIGRIEKDAFIIDVRTVQKEEEPLLISGLLNTLGNG